MKIKLIAAIILVATPLQVFSQSFAKWRNDNSITGLQIAKITNSTSSTTGVLCYLKSETCSAYLVVDAICEEDVTVPLMVNSKIGALPISAKCTKFGESHYLVINEFDSIIQAFQGGGEIGFAMPMESGQFKVVRFNTIGATEAIAAARKPPAQSKKSRLKQDESL